MAEHQARLDRLHERMRGSIMCLGVLYVSPLLLSDEEFVGELRALLPHLEVHSLESLRHPDGALRPNGRRSNLPSA